MLDPAILAAQIGRVLDDATIPELPKHYRGKVRDNYDLADGRRILVATDRLSAFDRNIAAIPFKGQVLTQTARFWFEHTGDICANHVLDYPDPNVLLCRRLDILPVEIVVRDYLAGTTATSIWSMYKAGRRQVYGIPLPDGLRENQKLPQTIITPTTKAMDGAHDEPLTTVEIVGRGLLSARDWSQVMGAPPCLITASQGCEAFFLDLNGDHRPEILLVTGNETRWWAAVMEQDAGGGWRQAGQLTSGCGATLSDLRAGQLSVLAALPGWGDLQVAGARLSVTPSGTGCSHY